MFDDFLRDDELNKLIEQVKISDDIFDVVDLNENQHSDMLAWCLNPNEGHAQGDSVIKDFLIGAHAASQSCTYATKQFFTHWTPGRIRTTSFGSAFCSREFALALEDGKANRLDLLMVDPANKFIVTIENKTVAKLGPQQLFQYQEAVQDRICKRPAFKDYLVAYVVINKGLESGDESESEKFGKRWAFMNYDWLTSAAERARKQVERHNQAAQLLMAFCQRQTEWENPQEKEATRLVGEICLRHEAVVEEMQRYLDFDLTQWTPAKTFGVDGEVLNFVNQHRSLCNKLLEGRGIGSVVARLQASNGVSRLFVDSGRTWVAVTSPEIEPLVLGGEDGYWPIYINVYRDHKKSKNGSRFAVRLRWEADRMNAKPAVKAQLRNRLGQMPIFARLRKFPELERRWVVLDENCEAKHAATVAVQALQEIDTGLKNAKSAGLFRA